MSTASSFLFTAGVILQALCELAHYGLRFGWALLLLLSPGLARAQVSEFGVIWNQAVMEYEYADPEMSTGRAKSRWVPVYVGWFPDVPPDHWAFDEVMACVGGRAVFDYTAASAAPRSR